MENLTLSVKFDTTSLDEAIEKVRILKKELRELRLPYFTGNPLTNFNTQQEDKTSRQ
ncbi:hypothetical protein ACXH4D_000364 [Klebsiella variicola]|uniref:hypothetical protein n=1 Tax=Klebsiella variicola TaxID=244366 RepID=UPI000E2B36A2|nr:hypothetical protein [Klebsiella variicola]SXF86871.1 Uncharacterised protein [Klebsiella variicola]HBW5840138.1 hypothetical protein [Klebsiella pneumoniae]HCF8496302.1 hypothetical protein [Klebsiella variicola subsp. variicola]